MDSLELKIERVMDLREREPYNYKRLNPRIYALMTAFGSTSSSSVSLAADLIKEGGVIEFICLLIEDILEDAKVNSNSEGQIQVLSNSLNILGNFYCFTSSICYPQDSSSSRILELIHGILLSPHLSSDLVILHRSLKLIGNWAKNSKTSGFPFVKAGLLTQILKVWKKIKELGDSSSQNCDKVLKSYLRLIRIFSESDQDTKFKIVQNRGIFIISQIWNWEFRSEYSQPEILETMSVLTSNKMSAFSKETVSEMTNCEEGIAIILNLIKTYRTTESNSKIHFPTSSILADFTSQNSIVDVMMNAGVYEAIFHQIHKTNSTQLLRSQIGLLRNLVKKLNSVNSSWILSDPNINPTVASSLKILENDALSEFHGFTLCVYNHLPKDSLILLWDSGLFSLITKSISACHRLWNWDQLSTEIISRSWNQNLLIPKTDTPNENSCLFWILSLVKKLGSLCIGIKEINTLIPTLLQLLILIDSSFSQNIFKLSIAILTRIFNEPGIIGFVISHQISSILARIQIQNFGNLKMDTENKTGISNFLKNLKNPATEMYLTTQIRKNESGSQLNSAIAQPLLGGPSAVVAFDILIQTFENEDKIIDTDSLRLEFENVVMSLCLLITNSSLKMEEFNQTPLCEYQIQNFNDQIISQSSPSSFTFKFLEEGGIELNVQEEILTENSPVFDAMFKNGFREGYERLVHISHSSYETFATFLTQLKEIVRNSDLPRRNPTRYSLETLFGLLDLSHQYHIPRIYDSTIATILQSRLSLSNVDEIYSRSGSLQFLHFGTQILCDDTRSSLPLSTHVLIYLLTHPQLQLKARIGKILQLIRNGYKKILCRDFTLIFQEISNS